MDMDRLLSTVEITNQSHHCYCSAPVYRRSPCHAIITRDSAVSGRGMAVFGDCG